MVEQQFCLRWNNYRTNITAEFETLREGEHFVDVTLACDGRQLKAHKVVLSACSPYFKELLQCNPCTHPIIILRDVAYYHMRSLLEFMYAGEVNVSQAHLGSFLSTAEALKIRGLAESSDERKDSSNCVSPLSAIKSSLGPLSNIQFGGLGSSFFDRPLIPHLVPPHSGDPVQNHLSSHHRGSPNFIGNTLTHSLSPSPYNALLPLSGHRKHLSPERVSNLPLGPEHPIVSYPLPVNMSPSDTSRMKGGDCDRKEPSSPISLPPNKRIRCDRRFFTPTSKESDKPPEDKAQNGGSFGIHGSGPNSDSASDAGSNKTVTTTCSGQNNAADGEDSRNLTPKTEPGERHASDTEGSLGFVDEGDVAGGGGGGPDSFTFPDAVPSHNLSADSENTSHLLNALSADSHHPGIMRNFEPLPCPICQRSYSSPGNLKQHLENIHMASTEPTHQCRICGNKFKSKWYLHKHLHRAHHIRGRKDPVI